MAGKVGMHRKLLSPARAEEVRHKIRATLLIKKLEDHVLDGKELSATQVSAALGLLRKAVPDLAASTSDVNVNHTGSVEHIGLSETERLVADALASGTERALPKPVPH